MLVVEWEFDKSERLCRVIERGTCEFQEFRVQPNSPLSAPVESDGTLWQYYVHFVDVRINMNIPPDFSPLL